MGRGARLITGLEIEMTTFESEMEGPTLREKIAEWSQEHANDYPAEIKRIFAQKTEELLRSGILSRCAKEGDAAPDFILPKEDGSEIQLSEKLKNGPVILSFYRGTWCPYCNLEFQELLSTLPQYRSSGAMILALSPQVINRFEPVADAAFEDLCDRGNKVAAKYGLVHPIAREIKKIYEGFGLKINEFNGDLNYELPLAATYVVDRDGQIRFAFTSVNYEERAEPRELVSVLSKLRDS